MTLQRLHKKEFQKTRKTGTQLILLLCVFVVNFLVFYNGKIVTEYTVFSANAESVEEASGRYVCQVEKDYTKIEIPVLVVGNQEAEVRVRIYAEGKMLGEKIQRFPAVETEHPDISIFQAYASKMVVDASNVREFELEIELNDAEDAKLYVGCSEPDTPKISYVSYNQSRIGYVIYFVVTGILVVLGVLFFRCNWGEKYPLETVFLFFAIPLASIFLILLPAGSTNDSPIHAVWLYQKTNEVLGHSEWNYITSTVMEDGDRFILEDVLYDSEQFLGYANPTIKVYQENLMYSFHSPNTGVQLESGEHLPATYTINAVQYLPFFVIVLLGRLFHVNFLLTLNIARIFAAALFILVIWYTIKKAPYGKEAIFVYALSPMMLQSMTAISYDYFSACLMFLGIALLLRMEAQGYYLLRVDKSLTWVIIVFLGATKGGIYMLPFVCVFGMKCIFEKQGRVFIGKNKVYFWGAAVLAVATFVLFNAGALTYVADSEVVNRNSFSYLLSNPGAWAVTIKNSVTQDIMKLFTGLFGGYLGWHEAVVPMWLVITNFVLFFICALKDNTQKRNWMNLILSLFGISMIVLIIYSYFWLTANQGVTYLIGLQGRYFIPIIVLVIVLCRQLKVRTQISQKSISQAVYVIAILNVLSMMSHYLRR